MGQSWHNNQQTSKDVALFGEVLADIFPDRHVLGGAPFNVACHLNGFQLNPVLVSRVGNDALKDELLAAMQVRNMNAIGVQQDVFLPTGQVNVTLDNGDPSYEILPEQAYDHIHAGLTHMVIMSIKPAIAYFGTLAQRSLASRLALDKCLSDARCPRFLDVNLRSPWYDHHTIRRSLLRADLLKLNEDELAIIAKDCKLKATEAKAQAFELLEKFNLKEVFVTTGKHGAWSISSDGETFTADSSNETIDVQDTVGAGDGFSAVCILGLINHWDRLDTLKRANTFAAAICGISGATPNDLDFYLPYKKAWGL